MRSAVVAAVAVTLLASAAEAQSSFSLAGGFAAPTGSVANELQLGYNATLGIGIQPPLAPIGMRLEGSFTSFNYTDDAAPEGARRLMSVTFNVTVSGLLPRFYLIGGMGGYQSRIDGVPSAPRSNFEMGFNAGAGFNLPLTGFSTFVEARLHHVPFEGSTVSYVPMTFGIRF